MFANIWRSWLWRRSYEERTTDRIKSFLKNESHKTTRGKTGKHGLVKGAIVPMTQHNESKTC